MKNKNLIFSFLTVVTLTIGAGCLWTSCDDWTETEQVDYGVTTPDGQNPELYATNGKTNCSIFKKHFVPGLPLLTQNKMCILLQKIEATYSVASIFALNLRKRSMVG